MLGPELAFIMCPDHSFTVFWVDFVGVRLNLANEIMSLIQQIEVGRIFGNIYNHHNIKLLYHQEHGSSQMEKNNIKTSYYGNRKFFKFDMTSPSHPQEYVVFCWSLGSLYITLHYRRERLFIAIKKNWFGILPIIRFVQIFQWSLT